MLDTNLYCRLKDSVRIKKFPSFCALIDVIYGRRKHVTPFVAFIMTLCEGTLRISEISIIVSRSFENIKSNIDTPAIIEEYVNFLDFNGEPMPENSRYDPEQYIYVAEPVKDDKTYHFETPVEMTMAVTNKCNFNCIYCFKSSGECMPDEMDTGQWLDAIDQAKELDVIRCNVTGGEPTLSPSFLPIVEHLVKKDIYPYISTNGTTLDKELVSGLLDCGIKLIQISLDSVEPDVHDLLTGTTGTLKKVFKGIETAIENGLEVRVKSVITPLNYLTVDKLIDFCFAQGVSNIALDRYMPGCNCRGNAKLILNDGMSKYIEKIVSEKDEYARNINSGAVLKSLIWKCADDIVSCGGLISAFALQPNGIVGVCEQIVGVDELTLGNIKEKTLKEMWNSEKVLKILNPDPEILKEPCKTCSDLKKCRTGCPAHTLLYSSNFFDPDPKCWKVNLDSNPFVPE